MHAIIEVHTTYNSYDIQLCTYHMARRLMVIKFNLLENNIWQRLSLVHCYTLANSQDYHDHEYSLTFTLKYIRLMSAMYVCVHACVQLAMLEHEFVRQLATYMLYINFGGVKLVNWCPKHLVIGGYQSLTQYCKDFMAMNNQIAVRFIRALKL